MFATRGRWRPAVATLGAATLLLAAGCSKSEDSGATTTNASAAAQVTQSASGPTCSLSQYSGLSKIDLTTAKVGFSQSEKEDNPFRIAETKSIKDEAAKLGITHLTATNAASDFNKQISDVNTLIDSGVQLLIIAPLNSDGWDSVFQKASAKKIPIITIDRQINGAACYPTYLTFIGSDFVKQGQRAADQMAKALNNTGNVAILDGAPGNGVTVGRSKGFKDELAKVAPNIKVVFEQTGNFDRTDGQKVTEQMLQAHPEVNGIYGENDEMSIGAVTALQGANKKAGDIKVVTVDGTLNGVKDIVSNWIFADIESNPRFGPLAFSTATDFFAGKPIPESIVIQDRQYDASTAQDGLSVAY